MAQADPIVVVFVNVGETEDQVLERMGLDPATVTPERCIFIVKPPVGDVQVTNARPNIDIAD
jgi:hypothetical protein